MEKRQLERLLNTACDIITGLEEYAKLSEINTEDTIAFEKEINAFFEEIRYSDEIDEMEADLEAQDESMGDAKI